MGIIPPEMRIRIFSQTPPSKVMYGRKKWFAAQVKNEKCFRRIFIGDEKKSDKGADSPPPPPPTHPHQIGLSDA